MCLMQRQRRKKQMSAYKINVTSLKYVKFSRIRKVF